MKYDEIETQMKYDGYEYFLGDPIDMQVCQESSCEECNHKGLKLAGFKDKYDGYRAFAVCPECDETIEF